MQNGQFYLTLEKLTIISNELELTWFIREFNLEPNCSYISSIDINAFKIKLQKDIGVNICLMAHEFIQKKFEINKTLMEKFTLDSVQIQKVKFQLDLY
jgi:hypothetical protein